MAGKTAAGVVTRCVVVISSVRLCAPLFKLVIELVPEKLHVDCDGRPEPQASDTDSGIGPVGVAVIT